MPLELERIELVRLVNIGEAMRHEIRLTADVRDEQVRSGRWNDRLEAVTLAMIGDYAQQMYAARRALAELLGKHPDLCLIGPKVGAEYCVTLNPVGSCEGYGVLPVNSGPVKEAGGLWAWPHAWLCEALEGRN